MSVVDDYFTSRFRLTTVFFRTLFRVATLDFQMTMDDAVDITDVDLSPATNHSSICALFFAVYIIFGNVVYFAFNAFTFHRILIVDFLHCQSSIIGMTAVFLVINM